jgi:hypothetical protein
MTNPECLDAVIRALRDCRGVLETRILTEEEKRRVLEVEKKAEEKVAYGMCKTLNRGVREALAREYAVALVIDSSLFEYPHHPHMRMVCGDVVVGEQVRDNMRIEELKKDRSNFFLWENFVLYMPKLPKGPEERKKLRLIYTERPAVQLEGHPCVERSVFGTPSMEGDLLVKELLAVDSDKPTVGTCVVGFDLKRE